MCEKCGDGMIDDDVLNKSRIDSRHFGYYYAYLAFRKWPTLCAMHPTNIIKM
jgi:hypothetical protein